VSAEFNFQYRFHPAGQGVFASGTLIEGQADQDPFDWVVDCGSTNQDVLKPAIQAYRSSDPGNRDLDLLCLTHFDKDHVSGLGDLLSGRRVETIVMPYYTPLERLIIGSRHRSAPRGYFDFLGNPVGYLLESAASIRTIILVGPPPPESDLGDTLAERRPRPTPGSEGRKMPPKSEWRFEAKELQDLPAKLPIVDDATRVLAESLGTELRTASGSFPAQVCRASAAGWEFLFFHKPIPPEAISQLKEEIDKVIARRFRRRSPDLGSALRSETFRKRIREIFSETIAPPNDINSTSLCVYSGPLPPARSSSISIEAPARLGARHYRIGCNHCESEQPKCSILYTGDTNLRKQSDRKELHDSLRKERRDQISVFQVPHRGSRYNWAPGAERHFFHDWSVFCADDRLKRPGHPHNEVFADLLYRNPILVNAKDGWNWQGTVHFP
jgi:hypothetical protein